MTTLRLHRASRQCDALGRSPGPVAQGEAAGLSVGPCRREWRSPPSGLRPATRSTLPSTSNCWPSSAAPVATAARKAWCGSQILGIGGEDRDGAGCGEGGRAEHDGDDVFVAVTVSVGKKRGSLMGDGSVTGSTTRRETAHSGAGRLIRRRATSTGVVVKVVTYRSSAGASSGRGFIGPFSDAHHHAIEVARSVRSHPAMILATKTLFEGFLLSRCGTCFAALMPCPRGCAGPVEAAQRAGNSMEVLLPQCAKCC